MEHNVYAPPTAIVADAPRPRAQEYYVVSRSKFLVLYFITFGAYPLYWFYVHWARFRRQHRRRLLPAARALFSIFFAHSLALKVDASLRRAGVDHRWSPRALATGYVLIVIGSTLGGMAAALSHGVPPTLVNLLSLPPTAYCLWGIQNAANHACAEPEGASNRRLTWANWIWIGVYGLLWLLTLVGVAAGLGLLGE